MATKKYSDKKTSAFMMENYVIPEDDIKEWISEMEKKYEKEKEELINEHYDIVQGYAESMPSAAVDAWWVSFIPLGISICLFIPLYILLGIYGGVIALVITSAIAIFSWMRVLGQTEKGIVERLGSFHRVLTHGFAFIVYPFDQMVKLVDTKQQSHQLYQSEGDSSIDFLDDTAPISAYLRYRVVNVVRFVYSTKDPVTQMEDRVDALMRPLLQRLNIDSADVHKSLIAKSIAEMIKDEFREIYGVLIETILITDIVHSNESKALRQERLAGTVAAQKAASVGAGYANAISALKKQVRDDLGKDISFEKARDLYVQLQTLGVIENTGANISFVSPDVQRVLKTLEIGGTK